MKVSCIYTSPRKFGNSSRIADYLCNIARKENCEVKKWFLHDENFSGCLSCNACKQGAEICVIQDCIRQALVSLVNADILIIAVPIYYSGFNSAFMAFIERSTSFFKYDDSIEEEDIRLPRGKTAVILQTQDNPVKDESFFFKEYFEHLGFAEQYFYCYNDAEVTCLWEKIQGDIEVLSRNIFSL